MKKLFLALLLSGLGSSVVFGMDEPKEDFWEKLPLDMVVEIMKQLGSSYRDRLKNASSLALASKFNLGLVTQAFSSTHLIPKGDPLITKSDPQQVLQNLFDSGEVTRIAARALEMAAGKKLSIELKGWNPTPTETLFSLIEKGKINPPTFAFLLHCGADLNKMDMYGWTVFERAQQKGLRKIVKLLIEKIDMHAVNKALISASMIGDEELVELLIKNHADVNTRKNNGQTALMCASTNGHKEIVKLLIKKNANVLSQDSIIGLQMARRNGHKEIVDLLEEAMKLAANKNVNCNNKNN